VAELIADERKRARGLNCSSEPAMPSEQEVMNSLAVHAIEQFVATFTIPIMYEFRGGDGILGTGTLFEIRERCFVITASHLFDPNDFREDFNEEFNPEKLACPDRRSRIPEQPTTFSEFDLCRAVQTGYDHDVAFMALKSAEKIRRLRSGWTFLTLDQVGLPTPEPVHFLAGYPVALVRQEPAYYSGPLAVVRTERLPEPPKGAQEPIDARFDFFFKYGTQVQIGGSDKIIESPRLQGASGGSLCQLVLTEEPLWVPTKALRIVAIQSTVARSRQWFRARSWLGAAELLRRQYPELADEIARRVLGKAK
jgi:hypothetical protein